MELMQHRIQKFDPERGKYVKYNTLNGEEMQAKQDGSPFKRVLVVKIPRRRKLRARVRSHN